MYDLLCFTFIKVFFLVQYLFTKQIVFLMAYTQTQHNENKILNRKNLFKYFAYQNMILKGEDRMNFIFELCDGGGGNNLS